MAVSLESSSPSSLQKDSTSASPPLFSPSSEKNYWSSLRNRVDTLLENRKLDGEFGGHELTLRAPAGVEELEKRKRLRKEDCLLLLRGFDSVSASLSQLTSNLDTAVNGARELAKPSFSEAFPSELEKSANGERGIKRKIVSHESYDDQDDHEQSVKTGKLTKAKNLAVSMAAKAATLARELKSIKAGLSFMQDRCSVLEEENRMLREGDGKQMRPEEDDLVRLQLEALLAEKSRLANENANLTRENQCLHQLVEYHQLTSQDLSASYEQVINGTCLDFSSPSPSPSPPIAIFSSPSPSPPIANFPSPSPSPPVAKDANSEAEFVGGNETHRTDKYGLSTSLDGWLCEEQHS